MSKTKLIVYRNGGIVKSKEKVFFGGKKIECVKYYKYLGVIISSRLFWSPAQMTLVRQGSKAITQIRNVISNCDMSFKIGIELFEKCIVPVLLYGCEIWGCDIGNKIEDVQLKFCRMLLGVGSKTAKPTILGECGRHRLLVRCHLRVIKYWIKVIHLPNSTLIKACYDMLYLHCQRGRNNWASKVKHILYRIGYGYIWEH